MRKKYKEQLPLMGHTIDHPHAAEMELIDKMFEKTSTYTIWRYKISREKLKTKKPAHTV